MEEAGFPSAGSRERALQLWASGVGIGSEVQRLNAALEDIRSVLTEAMTKDIKNEALERSLKEAWHTASRAEDLQSELDYCRIQQEQEDGDKLVHSTIVGSVNDILLSTPGADIHLSNDDEAQAVEDTTNNSALSIESSFPALQIVPYVASPVVHDADTSLVIHLELIDKDKILREINEHVQGCCKMAKYIRQALVLENLDYRIAQKYWSTRTDPRETSPLATEPKVYGRDEERNLIISKLISDESDGQNLSVLAIVGNGGVGKTTLAKVVFNDPAVLEHFDILLWVYVSVYFDQVKITRELLEHLCKDRRENTRELKELQNFLRNELKFKRVLLVLDDMWEDSKKEKWDELLIPFLTHAKGNKILVTTRKPSVARMTRAMHAINLGGLQQADFLCLFKECAFGDENYGGHRKLQKIGQQIVVKLKGYPLAVKTVGKLLRRKLDEEHWTRILESSEWKYQQDDNDIMPALRISYKYLPVHLQRCFSFCAIFPKNYRYDEKQLVNIWIALGFVVSTRQNAQTQAEEIGSKYLSDLIEFGFFLNEPPRSSILMHDLLHDLAQIISSGECFTIEEIEPLVASHLVRHASVITESAYYGQLDGIVLPNQCFLHEFSRNFSTLQKNNLRTLMLFGAHDMSFAKTFQHEFMEVKAVRVLNMEMVYPELNSLISNISAFINLRYLELRSYYYGPKLQLPEAICKLCHLQVLDIKHNWSAETVLPRGFNKLVNLRHFFADEELHAQIAGVGRLIFLQELKAFDVKEENEFSIAELGQLNELRGSIRIHNLQKLKSKEEATKARLHEKLYLTGLHFSWFPNRKGSIDTLESLEPPRGIESLRIDNYKCAAPSWICSNFYLTSLRSLHLQNCRKWSTLPPPQQLPFLRELHLIWMHQMDKIEVGHLKVLELRNIRKLRQCMELEREQACANLEILDIEDCHHLRGFPFQPTSSGTLSDRHFPRLRKLRMHDCGRGTNLPPLPLQATLTNIDIQGAFSNYEVFRLRPLNGSKLCLEIKGLKHVKKLDETILRFSELKDLQELEIKNYTGLTYLAWEGLQQMSSLKRLILLDCPYLFSNNPKIFVPASVVELEFATCNITGKQLSNLMSNLPVLQSLKLRYCKEITSLAVGMLVDENLMAEGTCHIPSRCLMTLEKLQISFLGVPHSSMFFLSKEGLGGFESLKEIALTNVGMLLSSMISEAGPKLPNSSLLPPSLLKLDITDVEHRLLVSSKLSSLVELNISQSPVLMCLELCFCTALRKLHLNECGMLQSIQGLQSPSFLTVVKIQECSKLASVQLQPCTSLQLLSIERCKALCTIDGPHSLSALKDVRICMNAKLSSVELHSCRTLEKLCITECPALASWQGFLSLASLKHLEVFQCPGFVSSWLSAAEEIEREGHRFSIPLKQLDTDDRSVLALPICRQLTALEVLDISGIHLPYGEVSILKDSQEAALSLLISLKDLSFSGFEEAQSLPATLHCLTSLQNLNVRSCPGIKSLPDAGLPPSLVLIDLCGDYSSELQELCMIMSQEQRFCLYTNGQEACTVD